MGRSGAAAETGAESPISRSPSTSVMSAVAEEAEEETGEGVACGEAVESAGSGAAIITGAAEAEEAEEAEEADAAGVEGSTSCLVT